MDDIQKLEGTVKKLDAAQYIIATIGNEQFGIDISFIDNIVRMQRITRVPKTQKYFKGVINLRGVVIPVMSLRLKFGLEEIEETNATRIIIIKPDNVTPLGIIVDSVMEVLTLEEEDMDKPDNADARMQHIAMIAKHGEELVSILNIPSLTVDKE